MAAVESVSADVARLQALQEQIAQLNQQLSSQAAPVAAVPPLAAEAEGAAAEGEAEAAEGAAAEAEAEGVAAGEAGESNPSDAHEEAAVAIKAAQDEAAAAIKAAQDEAAVAIKAAQGEVKKTENEAAAAKVAENEAAAKAAVNEAAAAATRAEEAATAAAAKAAEDEAAAAKAAEDEAAISAALRAAEEKLASADAKIARGIGNAAVDRAAVAAGTATWDVVLHEWFRMRDVNGSGTLEVEEYIALNQRMHDLYYEGVDEPFDEAVHREKFKAMDTSGVQHYTPVELYSTRLLAS